MIRIKSIVAVGAILVSVLFAPSHAAETSQVLRKNSEDKSVSRTLILENGLKVILISDPSFNSSAASLAVRVGSLADPKEHSGLAHFLEHMLF